MTSSALKVGQCLKGKSGIYTITKQLYPTTWLATDATSRTVIVKRDHSKRVDTERALLRRFQGNPLFPPLIDEIIEEPRPDDDESAAIVLRYYDCHVGEVVAEDKGLAPRESRYVGSCVLRALRAMHAVGYIHTDVKPGNILVNLREDGGGGDDMRFGDVCLADLGDALATDSVEATSGYPYGTPVFRSPEATLMMPFTTAHDIWSFGATMISLIYGGKFSIFSPACKPDDELYVDGIVRNFHKYFGPFPRSYLTLLGIDQVRLEALTNIINEAKERGLFQRASSTEISNKDRDFIWGLMKLDHRDRPTAAALLEHEWFAGLDG
ncbi:kinase-like domain-containing protein [Parachaetomium inaequale]|uniref:Kinase-like domain-containing protein n=1 Tax=Parachaetomium inaequale TaxID=2588326 RepID=A0AAN6SWH1_9PEZI|nr:kinase-like domain-containing protein [Parachaetomium inaequale]